MSPPRLYAIADVDVLGLARVPEAIAVWADLGVSWIQLRAKAVSGAALFRLTEACCVRLAPYGAVRLWLNDRVDIAAMTPVGGVHLGQRDLPPSAARSVLDPGVAIGRSTHDPAQTRDADADDAVDVVAVGPVFVTNGKADADPPVGLDGVRKARLATSKPLVAIGGIDAGNVAAVLAAGADSLAVLGGLCRGDVAVNCRRLLAAVEEAA